MSASQSGSRRLIFLVFGSNLGTALAKLFGALLSGSAGLLAESIHSGVDCANQILLLVGGKLAQLIMRMEFFRQ